MAPGALATVGDLLAHRVSLYASCRRCQHGSRVELRPIIAQHGLNYPVERVMKRLRCLNCFKWDAEVRVVPSGWRKD